MPFNASVRRAQLITTYGVGSIVPVEDQSVMIVGIDKWGALVPDVHEPRLERQLGVDGFVLPPAGLSGREIPVVRFPEYYSCPNCNRLDRHGFFSSLDRNKCNICNMPLIPSRFVVACERSHIDDFPYYQWVHAGKPRLQETSHVLYIRARGASAALRDIEISCSCGLARTMHGAFGRDALLPILGRCRGRRPWLGDKEDCDEIPRTLQRGASNVYFAITRSALSIPPWSEGPNRLLGKYWLVLKHVPEIALRDTIKGMNLARDGEYSVEDLVETVKRRKREENGDAPPPDDSSLRAEEYEALMRGKPEASHEQEFVCIPADRTSVDIWFDKVMLVTRLREVLALTAFGRLLPPSPADQPERRAALYRERVNWLPAIEVTGEGVFLCICADRLSEWERRPQVVERARWINRNYERKFVEVGAVPDRTVTARLLLLHTLAHALVGEWALAAGYPAASLRERLYVSDDMAGLLIYTATTDSAGSLGGVVDGAKGYRMRTALESAMRRAAWCSSDPLCIEAEASGVDALNLAACHACVLLPEVSCEESNVLLDRAMLVGTPTDPSVGFFSAVLE